MRLQHAAHCRQESRHGILNKVRHEHENFTLDIVYPSQCSAVKLIASDPYTLLDNPINYLIGGEKYHLHLMLSTRI